MGAKTAASPNGLLPIGSSFRGYVILCKIGSGGIGEVYLARHEVMGVNFAIKVIERADIESNHEARTRFLREARTAAQIRHPALLAVHDAGFDEVTGLYFLVMDYLSGGTVADELRRVHQFSIKRALQIVRTVAEGLAELEKHGVVHRDVKPSNMLMDDKGMIRLSDLGLVRDCTHASGTVTQLGYALGTPAYMSYEQIVDSHSVDTRTDIYALGVSLFEMLTGTLPDGELPVTRLLKKRVDGARIPDIRTVNPAIPDWLAETILSMTDPDVQTRGPTLDKLIKLFDSYLTESRQKKFALIPQPTATPVKATRYLLIGMLLGAFALIVAGGLFFEQEIGRLLASNEPPLEKVFEKNVEEDAEEKKEKPPTHPREIVREILREVTNEVVRVVAVTTVVQRVVEQVPRGESVIMPLLVRKEKPRARPPIGCTNVVEGIEICGTEDLSGEVQKLSEMITALANFVRDVYGLLKGRSVQSHVRRIELIAGDARSTYDRETQTMRVGANYGGFPRNSWRMANSCAPFMLTYHEGTGDPFVTQVEAFVREQAFQQAHISSPPTRRKKRVEGDPIIHRLLELELLANPNFLTAFFRARREAYAKRKLVGVMTKHDFAAVVSIATGETVFPYLRKKGMKVDEFATNLKVRGLPSAVFFGEH